MNSKLGALAIALALASSACSGSDDGGSSSFEIPDQPLSGTIAGEPWQMLSGNARPATDRTDAVFATFSPEAAPECDPGLAMPYAHTLVPLTPGEYAVSTDLPGAFVAQDETAKVTIYVTITGRVRVDSVDDTKIAGGLSLVLDDEPGFSIAGTFVIDRCPDL